MRGWFALLGLLAALLPVAADAQGTGACCVTAGCVQATEAQCIVLAGTFTDEGVPCSPSPCLPGCSVDPSELDYGRVGVGASRDLTFQVRNDGYVRAVGGFSESCAEFEILGATTYDLDAGEVQEFTVRFTPSSDSTFECAIAGTLCDGPLLRGEGSASPVCTVAPTSISFGSIGVGQFRDRTVTVRNEGDGLLVGSASGCGNFTVVSGGSWELAAGEEQVVTVRFRPTTEGFRSCTIPFGDECPGVLVSGTGEPVPACLVTPADVDFGEVELGNAADRAFTIENNGSGTLSGNVRVECGPFVLVGTTGYSLEAGESQDFTIRFLPDGEGLAECDVELGGACGVLPIRGVGVRPPLCAFNPSFLDFGDVPVGSARVETFMVANQGGSVLAGTFVSTCPEFEILDDPDYSLGAGESRELAVRFTPPRTGGIVCALESEGCEDFALRAIGTPGPECRVEPEEIAFGVVARGDVHARDFRIANDGGGILAGTARIETAGPASPAFRFAATLGKSLPFAVAAGEELIVEVELVADSVGFAFAEIVLDAGGAPCPPIALSAEVQDPPECALSWRDWDFGAVAVGSSAEVPLLLANSGGSTLEGEVRLSCSAFEIAGTEGGSLPYSLGAGDSLEVLLRFLPPDEGAFACDVDLGPSCGLVSLSGRGEFPPSCRIEPAEIDFGVVDLGAFADRVVRITNEGGGRLTGSLTSPCASFFFVGGSDYELGPGESRNVTVRFVPDRSGSTSCTLQSGGGCPSIPVRGSGNGPICVVSPTVLRFGTVLPGNARDLAFVVSNAGGGTLSGTVEPSCESFSIVGASDYRLAAGASQSFIVRFEPRTFGEVSCVLQLSGACADVQAIGSGGEPPLCEIDVERIDFGEVALGAIVRRSFTIRNRGEGRLRGQVTANCAGYRVIGNRSYDLGAEESATFDVELQAFEEGLLVCTLDLGSDCRQLTAVADVRLPLGACCYADGACAVRGETDCLGSGGIAWVEGIGCGDAGCVPLGACCALDGSCSLSTEEECLAAGGVLWSGGVGCLDVQCPPEGACCLLDGRCLLVVESACEGDFLGAESTCDPSPCPSLGACCFTDGSCLVVPESLCAPQGGLSWTLGASCSAVSCEPVGACCLLDGRCLVTPERACAGRYLGDESTCEPGVCLPIGGCCLADGSCVVVRQDGCAGTFLGADVPCTPEVCAPKVEDVRLLETESGMEIQVMAQAGSVRELSGWYRLAGTFTYREIGTFEARGSAWVAQFDPSASTVRGVEYYLSYVDVVLGLRVLHGEPDDPKRLRIRGSALVPWPPPGEFRMLAAPFEIDGAATLAALLEERLGPTGPRTWRLGTWDPTAEEYALLDATRPNAFEAGRAYWAIFAREPAMVEVEGETRFPPDRSYTHPIRLAPGWNMVGNPAAYPIRTDPAQSFIADRGSIFTLEEASSGTNPRVSPLYAYAPRRESAFAPYLVAPPYLEEWEGAWIENRTGHTVTLLLPAVDAQAGGPLLAWSAYLPVTSAGEPPVSSPGWEQVVTVRSAGTQRSLVLGWNEAASAGRDGLDLPAPPPGPGDALQAIWVLDEAQPATGFLRDVRAAQGPAAWHLEIRSPEPVELQFPDAGDGAEGRSARSRLQARLGPLEPWRRLSEVATWVLPPGAHRMEIERSKENAPDDPDPGADPAPSTSLPSIRLEPHPVTDRVSMLVTLPAAGSVQLGCFDASGARVWSFASGSLAAGTHLIRWDGRDAGGRRVEAGTYFLQLESPSGRATRKLVVLP